MGVAVGAAFGLDPAVTARGGATPPETGRRRLGAAACAQSPRMSSGLVAANARTALSVWGPGTASARTNRSSMPRKPPLRPALMRAGMAEGAEMSAIGGRPPAGTVSSCHGPASATATAAGRGGGAAAEGRTATRSPLNLAPPSGSRGPLLPSVSGTGPNPVYVQPVAGAEHDPVAVLDELLVNIPLQPRPLIRTRRAGLQSQDPGFQGEHHESW